MKKSVYQIVVLIVCTLFLASCNFIDKKKSTVAEKTEMNEEVIAEEKKESTEETEPEVTIDLYSGIWKGKIDDLDFELNIAKQEDGTYKGTNKAAENKRPVQGEITDGKLVLNEPGDNQYDGKFTLYFNEEEGILEGSWKANKGNMESSIIACQEKEETVTGIFKSLFPPMSDAEGWKMDFIIDGEKKYFHIPTSNQSLPKAIAGNDDITSPVNVNKKFNLTLRPMIRMVYTPGEDPSYEKRTMITNAELLN